MDHSDQAFAITEEHFINRELSWLEFNDRVLREGLTAELPLWERLKFLAIVSANLDEFFMIRVAGLRQLEKAGVRRRDIAGMTAREQLQAIAQRVHRMVEEQTAGICEVLGSLREHGIEVLTEAAWDEGDRAHLEAYFLREIQPVLTPLAVEEIDPPPLLPGLQLYLALLLEKQPSEPATSTSTDGGEDFSDEHSNTTDPTGDQRLSKVAVIPVPTSFNRFVSIPQRDGYRFALLEEVMIAFAETMCPGYAIEAATVFRITRDADVPIQDDDASDLLNVVEEAVLDRRRRAAVRLEVKAQADPRLVDWLTRWLEVDQSHVYHVDGPLDATCLWQIVNLPGYDSLKDAQWPPQPPRDLLGSEDLWETLRDRDVLISLPYESFEPVIQLVQEAADDPSVLAIKQTLYRTSGDSPIIEALQRAGQNGKEVTVLVELKARFDEARNVQWARRLEDAGCHVIYGIARYKTHAKALLIVRREADRIRRYVHLSTGNYNDRTAKLYSDIGMMTSHPELAADVAAFFNLVTGYSEAVGWKRLTVEPRQLKQRFLELIEREMYVSTPQQPGLILAKCNSLQDKDICEALYRAARAGVQIKLNIRGICCLRPGIPGLSESIEVRSIVDRFLEHARIFYFHNAGHEEVYLSSADWMMRNLERRLETIFPVLEPALARRLIDMLHVYFADNTKAWELQSDGSYRRVRQDGEPVRAQEYLYREAVQAAEEGGQPGPRYKTLKTPD